MLTELKLVLWKNLIIRKRHWFLTLTEALVPVILFGLISYGRSKITTMSKMEINEATTYEQTTADFLNNHLPVGEINLWYSPFNTFTDDIIKKVQMKFGIPGQDVQEFHSESELMEFYAKHSNRTVFAVTFKGDNPKKLDYDMRLHEKFSSWSTDMLFKPDWDPEAGSSKYIFGGFLALQLAIDSAFMETALGVDALPNVTFQIQEFPYPPHVEDAGFNSLFMTFLPLITLFSFIFMCPAVLKRVVEEKTSGIKELMKMVGMKSWMMWLGWFLHAFVANVPSIIIIVILMKISLWGAAYPPIEFCDGTVLFVFLLLYCAAAVTFCFLIASLFSRPSIAMVFGILVWIFSYFIPKAIVTDKQNLSWCVKALFGAFPNMALHYGYAAISVFETREVGVNWNNLFKSGSDAEDDVTMGNVFLILIADTLIFMILTVYIDNVNPGQFGIAKPVHYPILCLKRFVRNLFSRNPTQVDDAAASLTRIEEGRGEKVCIEIRNLRKKFGPLYAVDGLNLDIYKDRITVLLGHNGAGKTTTMSIITGMISATEGTVKINGVDIRDDISHAQHKMGLCPQHNLLFPDLTVIEHLQFFSMLKGSSCVQARIEAEIMLGTLGIAEKKDGLACTLSGGMKRKLCLGMALIGNSPVLILDEPTAGMDPESRRKVWDMLLEYRKTKTILVTTHFMEEADVLGDWIAIMAHGNLFCHGTPIYLKKTYGTGYHLHVSLKVTDGTSSKTETLVEDLTRTIQDLIPEAAMLRQNETKCNAASDSQSKTEDYSVLDLVYVLPLEATAKFSKLFRRLDQDKDAFGIENMRLTVTNLNDVFLKTKSQIDCNNGDAKRTKKSLHLKTPSKVHHPFWTLIHKRVMFFSNKWFMYIPSLVVMIAIMLLTVYLGQKSGNYYTESDPKLYLSLSAYGKTGVFYGSLLHPKDPTLTQMRNFYKEVVESQDGNAFPVADVSQAIVDKGIENIAYYKRHMIAAAEFNVVNRKIVANAMYSSSSLHGAPISLSLATNAVAKTLLGGEYSIATTNAPLPSINSDFSPSEQSAIEVALFWLIFVPIGMLFLMGNFIIFPNAEIVTKFYQIQILCGVRPWVFWLSNFVFDMITCVFKYFIVLAFLPFVAYSVFGLTEYATLFIIFVCYSVSAIPFAYLFSFKKTIAGGFATLLMIGMFVGVVPTVVVTALEMSGNEHYEHVGGALKHFFLLTCPQFGLSYVCVKFAQHYVANYNWLVMSADKRDHFCRQVNPNPCCKGDTMECQKSKNYFTSDELGIWADLLEMMLPFFLYSAILLSTNNLEFHKYRDKILKGVADAYKSIRNRGQKNRSNENYSDTLRSTDSDDDRLRAKELRKSFFVNFENKPVVRNVSFNIQDGKCFGLLGVNGAGKTTTFRMLTMDIYCDEGEIFILRKDGGTKKISVASKEYLENVIGYCPQHDALNYSLTGRQLLTIMACLRGYSREDAKDVAVQYLGLFDLEPYSDKPCLQYSGGNKRKLNACLAFVGFPQVILLDEPTNGVDPDSRKNFWDVLSFIKQRQNTSFVLCSHSMEECEVLCDNIGIMKNGIIECNGSLMELKQQYQEGFTVTFKLNPTVAVKDGDFTGCDVVDGPGDEDPVEALKRDFRRHFRDSEIKDEHSTLLHYHVKDGSYNLARVFEKVEAIKQQHSHFIEDYTISQASLEDIFLSVANSTN